MGKGLDRVPTPTPELSLLHILLTLLVAVPVCVCVYVCMQTHTHKYLSPTHPLTRPTNTPPNTPSRGVRKGESRVIFSRTGERIWRLPPPPPPPPCCTPCCTNETQPDRDCERGIGPFPPSLTAQAWALRGMREVRRALMEKGMPVSVGPISNTLATH